MQVYYVCDIFKRHTVSSDQGKKFAIHLGSDFFTSREFYSSLYNNIYKCVRHIVLLNLNFTLERLIGNDYMVKTYLFSIRLFKTEDNSFLQKLEISIKLLAENARKQ